MNTPNNSYPKIHLNTSGTLRKLVTFLLALGIGIRFYCTFIGFTFNVDEISITQNVISSDYQSLLKPLQQMQSAPPLFLFCLKFIYQINPFSPWIAFKVIPFICSVLSLFLFAQLALQKRDYTTTIVLGIALFALNPYIIYNSLLTKQYCIDLLYILLLANYLPKLNELKLFTFILLFSFLSNVTLFSIPAIFIMQNIDDIRKWKYHSFLRRLIPLLFAALPYVLYFLWYNKQTGAEELKEYMQQYWAENFLSINSTIVTQMLFHLHGISVYLFSSYQLIGILLLVVFTSKLLLRISIWKFQLYDIILLTLGVHLILNMMHYYPLSERHYLYAVPFFYLTLVEDVTYYQKKIGQSLINITIALSAMLYITYLPYQDNDVKTLYKRIPSNTIVLATGDAYYDIMAFNQLSESKYVTQNISVLTPLTLGKATILISRCHQKFGHKKKKASERETIKKLLLQKKISLESEVDGYSIYHINR